MIHILLTTLKVIGILLAITLALILSIILIVLFVPIRYKGKIENTNVDAKITWLLHLVSIKLEYKQKKFKYIIKILGITINRDKKKKSAKTIEKTKETNEVKEKSVEPLKAEKIDEKPSEPIKTETNKEKPVIKKRLKEKKSLSQKLSEVINNIKFKIRKLCDKIKKIKNKISDYKEFLTTDEARTNIKEMFRLIIGLLVYILPTKLKGNIKFGFENPETTGKALGCISLFHGIYGGKIELEPDFENKVFEANAKFKGRIRLYKPLIVAFKIWRNQWLKKFIKFTKTH